MKPAHSTAYEKKKKTVNVKQANESSPDDYIRNLRKKQGYMPLVDHLSELRIRVFRSFLWIALFSFLSYVFFDKVWYFLFSPIEPLVQKAVVENLVLKFITTKVFDYFVIQVKVVFISGMLFALPAIMLEIWKFISPALKSSSRILGYTLVFFSFLLFWSGVLFAWKLLWPMIIDFMIFEWTPPVIESSIKPEVHLTLDDYLSFFTSFHIAFGLAFQLPIISVVLAVAGIINFKFFINNWQAATLVIAIASAVITPPDVLSMLAMMIPLMILYLLSGILVFFLQKKSDE